MKKIVICLLALIVCISGGIFYVVVQCTKAVVALFAVLGGLEC